MSEGYMNGLVLRRIVCWQYRNSVDKTEIPQVVHM